MLTLILKLNHRKKCIQLLTFLILFSLMMSVGVACLHPQVVYASVAGTIAGYILTLFASFNTAITNPEVIGAINNTFGQMSMIEADAAAIDQGIASIAASTGFDMASIFANTAEEAAQVIASAPAGSVLEGAEAIAATAGVNIAAGAGSCATSATGAVLPAIGGLVLPAVGAVALGVAGGFLINHIRNVITNHVKYGKQLNTPSEVMTNIPESNFTVVINGSGNNYYFTYDYGMRGCVYIYNSRYHIVLKNYTKSNLEYCFYNQFFSGKGSYGGVAAESMRDLDFGRGAYPDLPIQGSYNECVAYLNSFDKGLGDYNLSPDIIGDIGNQTGIDENGTYNIPNVYPVYNYGDTIINYINPTDYNTFVQNANQNTADGLTGEDTQGNYFDNFVTPYIQTVEQVPDNPNPDNPNPDIPNPEQKPTVPYPDPEEYPDAIPEVNPVPDIDIAPTAIPYPELPEPTNEEITETNDKITPFDLKNKFPFCLPFDIHKALSKLKGARKAPYFVWQIPFGDAGEQTVTVDLSEWDEVASILRLLELLLFIVGLAVATRNLIGGT